MIVEITGTCQYENCNKPATTIACGHCRANIGHPIPACYCDDHAAKVGNEGSPEYTVDCPNCGCRFGVN